MNTALLPALLLLLAAGDGWIENLKATVTREGAGGVVRVRGRAKLPDGAMIQVRLRTLRELYNETKGRIEPSSRGKSSKGRKLEVRQGTFDVNFPGRLPGLYEVVVSINPTEQTDRVRKILARRKKHEPVRIQVTIANPAVQLALVRREAETIEDRIRRHLELIGQHPEGGKTLVRKIQKLRDKLWARHQSTALVRASATRLNEASGAYASSMEQGAAARRNPRGAKKVEPAREVAILQEEMQLCRVILGQELVIWHLRFLRGLFEELETAVASAVESEGAERPDLLAKNQKELDELASSFSDVVGKLRVQADLRDALRELLKLYRDLARALPDKEVDLQRIQEALTEAIKKLQMLEEKSRKVTFVSKFAQGDDADQGK